MGCAAIDARLIELIGGDKDAWTAETEARVSRTCSRRFNPALDACLF